MVKSIFILGSVLLFFNTALAQKKDTAVYYLTNSGKVVSTSDSADYFMEIIPPDANIDKNLFIVKEFYSNGKLGLVGNSLTNSINNLKFQGTQITFYPNGHKKIIRNFNIGYPVGGVIEYYPNGKFYNIKTYEKNKTLYLKQCNDSLGNVLAEDGKGIWINFFDGTFNQYAKGPVVGGIQEGEWKGERNNVNFVWIYKKGEIISSTNAPKPGFEQEYENNKIFTSVDVVPEFPGGIQAFMYFLMRNIRYPALARENNTTGRVIISFVVERDGTLTDVKVARRIGDGCDEEALRVIKASPVWQPGSQNGKPVRVAYSIPIAFSLKELPNRH